MSLTILSAAYANEDNSAAIVVTQESGAVALSAKDTPNRWAELHAWGTPTSYVPPPVPTIEEIRDQVIQAVDDARSIDRAIVLELTAENHALRDHVLALHRAIKASTTYANLKTGVTAVAEYVPKTPTQVRAGIRGRIT